MASPRPRRRPARPAISAWLGGILLLLTATTSGRAQQVAESLSVRIQGLAALDTGAVARECGALARGINESATTPPRQRAGDLDQLRAACGRRLSWTDPALVALAERVVECRRALVAEEPAPFAESLRNLGLSYHYLSRLDAALQLYQEAVAVSRRFLGRGTTSEDIAAALESLSSLLLDQRRFHEASAAADESLDLRRRAVPLRPEMVVTALVTRARIEEELDLAAAKATLLEAHALCRELGPGHEGDKGRVANNLGETLYRLGDLPQAITLLQEAEKLYGSLVPPSRRLATTQLLLGEVLSQSGDYPRALEYYRKGVAGHRAWLGEEPFRYCDALSGLASVLEATGQWEEALALEREALAIREAALGSKPAPGQVELQLILARSLTRLGALQRRMGAAPGARASLERALGIQDGALGGTANVDRAASMLELADYWLEEGDQERARSLADRCLRELAALGERSPLLLRATETAARVTAAPAAALRALEDARRQVGPAFGDRSPWAASLLQTRAELRLRQNDAAGALDDALLAQEISLPQVRTVVQAFPRDQALVFAANRRRSLDLALRLTAEHAALRAHSVTRVWQVAASSRMLVLNAEIDRQRLLRATADPQLASEAKLLAAAREGFAYLLVRNESSEGARRDQLQASRRELRAAEETMAARLRHLLPGSATGRITLAKLRQRLPAGAALVAFFQYRRPPGGDAYLAFVLNRSTPPSAVRLGTVLEIDWLIQQWRNAILSPHGDAAARRQAGLALRQAVWDPIARRLGDSRTVFVVPDGALHLVPLMALSTPGGGYLVEEGWEFHTLTSERDLLARPAPRGPGPWLAVGGIDYDRAAWQVASTAAPTLDTLRGGGAHAGDVASRDAEACPAGSLPFFAALPGSRAEIEELRTLWRRLLPRSPRNNAPLTVLTGQEATKQAFRSAVHGQRLVHLATHGFAVAGHCGARPPAVRGIGGLSLGEAAGAEELEPLAGLVLAGANRRAPADDGNLDGILTAAEILDLDLHAADWVVLSACDSGLGTVRAGEGVVGILRAFQVAGAKTVVVSLWSIDDQDAREWMRELYRARFERRVSTREAMRQATLRSLQISRKQGDDNPARWAGFVATGQWN
ncbi:MAG TPA: CHAT domain-containing protein [Thermoanaerobaculia bacterium]|nr:CHAT domain-containing protein [Thermoanaerobaculia bacterium]